MLKFFRRIRQQLLTQNKLSKYLLYAIGEIILVVIGILIALQINNWNEGRKRSQTEVQLLQTMKQAIEYDIKQTKFYMEGNERVVKSCKIILNALDNDVPYHDSLSLHFEQANQWWKVLISKHAYENAKLYGLDFIEHDFTRNQLSSLYEGLWSFAETLDERQAMYYYQTVTPVLSDLFESIDHNWHIAEKGNVPYDYEALKKDKTYRNILNTNIGNRENYNAWIQLARSNMTTLQEFLKNEIENR
jgi:hypothetical protein